MYFAGTKRILIVRLSVGNKVPFMSIADNAKYFFGAGGTPDGQIPVTEYVSATTHVNSQDPNASLRVFFCMDVVAFVRCCM